MLNSNKNAPKIKIVLKKTTQNKRCLFQNKLGAGGLLLQDWLQFPEDSCNIRHWSVLITWSRLRSIPRWSHHLTSPPPPVSPPAPGCAPPAVLPDLLCWTFVSLLNEPLDPSGLYSTKVRETEFMSCQHRGAHMKNGQRHLCGRLWL